MATQSNQQHPREPGIPRVPLYGLFALGVLYTLYLAHEVILPVTLAVLASLLLAPVVNALARRRIPRALSALVLLSALVGTLGGLTVMVANPILDWLEEAPEGVANLLVTDGELYQAYDRMTRSAREVEETVGEFTEEEAAERPTTVVLESESWRGQFAGNARTNAVALALALALCFFLLVSGNTLITNFVRQLADRRRQRAVLMVIRDAQREIARYLAVITASNSLVGLLTGLLLWGMGLPSPVVWGVIAALLRFVPYLGVFITTILLGVVAAVSLDDPLLILVAPLGYLALNTVVGFFLEPYIHGFRMSINPVVIFLSIFFWGWLWGAIGVLLAVPLMTVIQVVLRRTESLRPVYRLISR